MLSRANLRILRWHLLLLLASISSALLYGHILYADLARVEQETAAARAANGQALKRLSQVREEEGEIKQFLDRYRDWDDRLAFTEFNRAWVADQAAAVRQVFPDSKISFSIGGMKSFQNNITGKELYPGGGYQASYYPIELKGRVLHEVRFLSIYQQLNQLWRGPVNWEKCELKRIDSLLVIGRTLPFLEFTCEINWVQISPMLVASESGAVSSATATTTSVEKDQLKPFNRAAIATNLLNLESKPPVLGRVIFGEAQRLALDNTDSLAFFSGAGWADDFQAGLSAGNSRQGTSTILLNGYILRNGQLEAAWINGASQQSGGGFSLVAPSRNLQGLIVVDSNKKPIIDTLKAGQKAQISTREVQDTVPRDAIIKSESRGQN